MNNYIDLHSHILDGIDDGSKNLEESIEMIQKMESLGFNGIVATPHYIEGSIYNANNFTKKNRLDALRSSLIQKNSCISLYLGNEIFICDAIESLVKSGEISAINGTFYLLIELPFEHEIASLNDYLFRLRSKGYKIILAHPERYRYFQEHPEKMKEYIDMGILFQCNYGSIVGQYGKRAMKAMQTFLKKGYIHILSSDVHKKDSEFFPIFPVACQKIKKIVGEDMFRKLSFDNSYQVLNNMNLDERVEC